MTAPQDGTAKLWVPSGQCFKTFEGHRKAVNSAAFSPDDKEVMTASQGKTAKLWGVSCDRCLQTFDGHSGMVYVAAFSPVG